MFKILKREMLTPNICKMVVSAPRIAKAARPGQFLIVLPGEEGERIPLTISDYDRKEGTVTIVTQLVGASSAAIIAKEEGEFFRDVVGPLGNPSAFVNMDREALEGQRYIFIAGGLGTAPVYP
ncbi:MAG: NAD-binding oxidoreductase, partial [Bacteroidales bacterium]|nr:NAD-binding oxidoreductase [Bacteroidales bacterium]